MNLKDILNRCIERLDKGKEEYGDDSYMGKDLFQEINEEAYDIINYAVMLIDKTNKLKQKYNSLTDESLQTTRSDMSFVRDGIRYTEGVWHYTDEPTDNPVRRSSYYMGEGEV